MPRSQCIIHVKDSSTLLCHHLRPRHFHEAVGGHGFPISASKLVSLAIVTESGYAAGHTAQAFKPLSLRTRSLTTSVAESYGTIYLIRLLEPLSLLLPWPGATQDLLAPGSALAFAAIESIGPDGVGLATRALNLWLHEQASAAFQLRSRST